MSGLKPLDALAGNQRAASDPSVHAALSASAGTGKTHVLTARVLRLLLQGVAPETILCLTFTKAAAAEMSNRIGSRLAHWVRLKDDKLGAEISALGEPNTPEMKEQARCLFARVLDAPGGLRIQTIHSFAQALLAAFPAEAGIVPGFEALDDRASHELARDVLADLASKAEEARDRAFLDDISALSRRLGEDGALTYLMRCGDHAPSLAKLPADPLIEPALRDLVGLPDGDVSAMIIEGCSDQAFDRALVERLITVNRDWGTKTGLAAVERLLAWLERDGEGRAASLDEMRKGIVTNDGIPAKAQKDQDAAEALADRINMLMSLRYRAELADVQAAGLRAGARFARAFGDAKKMQGVADFNDLIRWTSGLLDTPGMGDWVRYKLDQRTDHILVDEAQDTNADQWHIVKRLAEEFFSGSSEADERFRTAFLVGDFKQAIYGFQGSRPEEFRNVRKHFDGLAAGQYQAWESHGQGARPRAFEDLSISTSYRSSQAILDSVNQFVATTGHEALGLEDAPPPHRSHDEQIKGRVELWPAYQVDEDAEDSGEEGWLPDRDRLYARDLAKQVAHLINEEATPPGDILILLRSRQLAPLIVARLYEEKVRVAGVDRLLLSQPLAVRDLVAAMQFAAQPLDDLNLACLLVSPLIGWDQDKLYRLAFGRGKASLWGTLRRRREEFADAFTALSHLLSMADYEGPAAFLEVILSGPMQGRSALLARLGSEVQDPIDALMNAALNFEREEGGSLDRFLDWLGRGDVEVKREAGEHGDAVRIMTVHGSKGLEAPVVILADATANPSSLGGPQSQILFPLPEIGPLPLIKPRKAERFAPFDAALDAIEARELEEHWRLLYVAMTRAARRLIVTGTFPARGKTLPDNCWWLAVERALEAAGADAIEAPWGGQGLAYESGTRNQSRKDAAAATPAIHAPAWLHADAPPEARPPRPLAPSAPEEGEEESYPPPGPEMRAAARRGTLLHALFERLPPVAADARCATALNWLETSGGIAEPEAREEIADAALAVIEDPSFAPLFGPDALAEAPIAATLDDGRVVAGTADRLLVEADRITVVDFKTGRFVPDDAASVPVYHARQMQAYADALKVIFPDRRVEAALLYTAGPKLISLPT